jgi:hypothetical protein
MNTLSDGDNPDKTGGFHLDWLNLIVWSGAVAIGILFWWCVWLVVMGGEG